MVEKITVTRALAELKLLDSRIKKEIQGTIFVDAYRKRDKQTQICGKTNPEFEADVKARSTSIRDLITRRANMKSAILRSNAENTVKIDGETYTVTEAIERKNSIEYEKILLNKMKSDFSTVREKAEQINLDLERKVGEMLLNNLGTDKRANKDDYDNIAKPFMEQNQLNVLDPIKIEKKIEDLEKKIDSFLSEVDFVLSEANAKNKIEI